MKKRLTLLLTGLLLFTFASCGTSKTGSVPSDTEGSTQSSQKVEATQNETEGPVAGSEEPEPVPETYLKELFAQHGMKVGTCLTTQMINDPEMSKLITGQFNSVTMENSMKPDYIFNQSKSIAAGDLVVEFNSDMIQMLEWAKANNMSVRGHTLVWYSQTPEWIFHADFDSGKELVGREVMLARLESFIKQVFEKLEEAGYADLFYAYDVANEAWMEDGSMRESNWTKTIGEDYLLQAFTFADRYAPEHIDLYYNDYNEQFKTDTLVSFVKTLVTSDGRSLIDGIGFQAHLYTMDDLDAYFKTVDALAATGLKVELTELDVCLGEYQKPLFALDENTRVQGQFYYNLINGLFARVDDGSLNMDALTFWGFSDGLSWRREYSPLLYNKKLEPKYAYYGAMQMKELAGFDE